MMKQAKITLLLTMLFAIATSFQGCSGCTENPALLTSVRQNASMGGGGDGQPIEGKPDPGTYYRTVPGFECAGQIRNHSFIEVGEQRAVLHGVDATTCRETLTDLPLRELEKSALTPGVLGYTKGIYEKRDQAPDPVKLAQPFAETWCRMGGTDPVDVLIQEDLGNQVLTAQVRGMPPRAPELKTVARQSLASKLSYNSTDFDLSIDRQVAISANEFSARLKLSYAGKALENVGACRVGALFDEASSNKPLIIVDLSAPTLPASITYSRTGTGTIFDSNGNVVVVGPNVPRIDHEPISHRLLGLLVESSNTNELLQSQNLSAANWTPIAATVSGGGTLVGLPSFEIRRTGSALTDGVRQSINVTAGTLKQVSFFVAQGASPIARVFAEQAPGEVAYVDCDLRTGAIDNYGSNVVSLVGFDSDPVVGGYRVSMGFRSTKTTITVGVGTASTRAGDSVYATGAQVETGEGSSSYIPTTTVAVSRGTDRADVTDVSWFNPQQGTLYVNVTRSGHEQGGAGAIPGAMQIRAANGDAYSISFSVSTGNFSVQMAVGASDQGWGWNADNTSSSDYRPHQVFLAYAAGNTALNVDGQTTTGPANSPMGLVPSRLSIGLGRGGQWSNHIKAFSYWPNRLSDQAMEVLGR